MKGDLLSLRRAYEKVRGELRDEDAPGKGYLELKVEEFHDGELSAEHLSEVTTVSEERKAPAAGGSVDLRWDNVLQLRTGRHTVAVPRTPEEFRHRVRVMRTLWAFLKLKGVAPQMLSAYDGTIWDEYVEHVLGPQGWSLRTLDEGGSSVAGPSWRGVLTWEHELRKDAVKRLNQGAGFSEAIRAALKDPEVRMRYFLQPMAVATAADAVSRWSGGGGRFTQGAETGFEPDPKRFKGDGGKGNGKKGPGKGPKGLKGKGNPGGEPPKTLPASGYWDTFRRQRNQKPETLTLEVGGKRVCYDHQGAKGGCKKKDCQYAHVCALCGATGHGYEKCPKVKGQ